MNPSYRHGQSPRGAQTNIYRRWQHMIQRCHNPNDRDYPRYGARGIAVCDRWRSADETHTGFEYFLADMGPPPSPSHSIDRLDVNGDYSPTNCRWATPTEQANNRRSTKMITVDGETKPLSVWCKEYGIGSKTVLYRLKHMGMTHTQAIKTPLTWTRNHHASNSQPSSNHHS